MAMEKLLRALGNINFEHPLADAALKVAEAAARGDEEEALREVANLLALEKGLDHFDWVNHPDRVMATLLREEGDRLVYLAQYGADTHEIWVNRP